MLECHLFSILHYAEREQYVNWKHFHLENKLLVYPIQHHAQTLFIITVVWLQVADISIHDRLTIHLKCKGEHTCTQVIEQVKKMTSWEEDKVVKWWTNAQGNRVNKREPHIHEMVAQTVEGPKKKHPPERGGIDEGSWRRWHLSCFWKLEWGQLGKQSTDDIPSQMYKQGRLR